MWFHGFWHLFRWRRVLGGPRCSNSMASSNLALVSLGRGSALGRSTRILAFWARNSRFRELSRIGCLESTWNFEPYRGFPDRKWYFTTSYKVRPVACKSEADINTEPAITRHTSKVYKYLQESAEAYKDMKNSDVLIFVCLGFMRHVLVKKYFGSVEWSHFWKFESPILWIHAETITFDGRNHAKLTRLIKALSHNVFRVFVSHFGFELEAGFQLSPKVNPHPYEGKSWVRLRRQSVFGSNTVRRLVAESSSTYIWL